MDDFIYFLLLIGWLAFSFYQQSVKKKKKLEQMRAAEQMQQQTSEEPEYENRMDELSSEASGATFNQKPDIRSAPEEMLLGQQISLENIPENEAQSLETMPEDEYNQKDNTKELNIYQKYYDTKIADNQPVEGEFAMGKTQEITDEEEKELLSDENERMDDGEFSPQNHIDLRQAVIYSEILNRRYTN